MTNNTLVELVTPYDDIVIWGHTLIGDYTYDMLKEKLLHKRIVICDNSKIKQVKYNDTEVVSPQKAWTKYPNALFLLTSKNNYDIMKNDLLNAGIKADNILLCVTLEAERVKLEHMRRKKYTPLQKLQFEVDITSHCNLNCKCCSQFSSIAEEEFADLTEVERDFTRLSQLFGGEVERIYLIGGEPLLHPRIADFVVLSRKCFPVGKISVFTNGLLLLKQREEFWKVCRENNVGIIITRYPIALDYEGIFEKAGKEEVNIEVFGTSNDFKYMTNLGLDVDGSQNPKESFENCFEANNCIKLMHGKLFTCTRPAAIYKFNRFFGENLEVRIEDYVDIYKMQTKEQIMEALAKPIPFCRYCNMKSNRQAFEWGRTSGDIREWLQLS